ncbi:DUF885 domain-containing protein [Catenuloplanes atrovinosus]|uniref:Uncharacterized protein (DUF885 family) n=1 Tax=Catenuloplanes atrovinosus TaxID=137266 RepID=A0AAE3YMV5_9ACTN|nr:DUF885 domain-containing protein [Catenuloplanes atrovinosus]MDR7275992.1 uncharacterized protein (DUF885 family) [Catenuloplanes atrovinosus]
MDDPVGGKGLRSFLRSAFEDEVALSPQAAATLGMEHDRSRLDDHSDAGWLRHAELLETQLSRLRERFPAETLSAAERLDAELFAARVERVRDLKPWRHHLSPWSRHQILPSSTAGSGADSIAGFLMSRHPVTSARDAEDYVARLREAGRALEELAAGLDTQRRLGITPTVREIAHLRRTLAPYEDGPLLADLTAKVEALGLDGARASTLLSAAETALAKEVRTGRDRYSAAIDELADRPRADDGVWSLPDGDAYYAAALRRWTTTGLSADEIHRIGLDAVARIDDEMRDVARAAGFAGTAREFREAVRTDARFRYPGDDAGRARYLADMRRDVAAGIEAAPRVFRTLPVLPIEVHAVEQWRAATAPIAFYEPGSVEVARPARFYTNLANIAEAQRYQLPAIVYHEALPGHHLQIALAQELPDVPAFRRTDYSLGAYVEGWGLYAERLADELGLYGDDPYLRFGMLSAQMWRACRLVLDTGIHAKRWTRDRAIEFFAAHTALSRADIEKETDRYIGMPGQATAYMIGQLRIQALRDRAESTLGARFDLRDFHDAVLRDGALPLDVLDARVGHWIAETAG